MQESRILKDIVSVWPLLLICLSLAGGYAVLRYKVKLNCNQLKDLIKSLIEVREKLPLLLTDYRHDEFCDKRLERITDTFIRVMGEYSDLVTQRIEGQAENVGSFREELKKYGDLDKKIAVLASTVKQLQKDVDRRMADRRTSTD